MDSVIPLLVKGVLGGTFVVVFAVLSEMLDPKSLSGILGAAPSIACGALVVIAATDGVSAARTESISMIAGAAGMIAYCIVAIYLVDRLGALGGSAAALVAWTGTAALGWAVLYIR